MNNNNSDELKGVVVWLISQLERTQINQQNKSGKNTALHWAALNGHGAVVEELMKAGADVTLKNDQGRTAAYEAEQRGHEKVLLLLSAGKGNDPQDEDVGVEEGEEELNPSASCLEIGQ